MVNPYPRSRELLTPGAVGERSLTDLIERSTAAQQALSGQTISTADATDLASVIALTNELKAKWNALVAVVDGL